MPIREARTWHVYRYQNPGGEHDGKLVLALLVDLGSIQGVLINSEPAKSGPFRRVEVQLRLDFLPRPSASIRFDTLICGSFEDYTTNKAERNWVVTGKERNKVLEKALSAESRLSGKVKKRLRQENLPFINHWAKRTRP